MTSPNTVQEIESKWTLASPSDADPLRRRIEAAGATISKPRNIEILDHYLDTRDGFFRLARARCRLRCCDGVFELNLKGTGEPSDGVFSRPERTYSLEGIATESEALDQIHGHELGAVLRGRKLELLFGIRNRRTQFDVTLADGTTAELCFDDAHAFADGRAAKIHEAELEFREGDLGAFRKLVADIGRAPVGSSERSKFRAAVEALELTDSLPEYPEYAYALDDTIGRAGREAVARNLRIIELNEPGVRVGFHEEAIHDMRVAARRTRAALAAFRKVLPRDSRRLAGEAKWLGQALGKGRDLEVQIESLFGFAAKLPLDQRRTLVRYRRILEKRLAVESEGIVDVLNSPQYPALVEGLQRLVSSPPRKKKEARVVREAGPKILAKATSRILDRYAREIDPRIHDEHLHKLRLDLKRVRYVFELFSHVGAPEVGQFVKATKKMQDILGTHQDVCTGIEMLRHDVSALRARARKEDEAGLIDALADLTDLLVEEKEKLRQRFFRSWPDYRVRRDMEQAAAAL